MNEYLQAIDTDQSDGKPDQEERSIVANESSWLSSLKPEELEEYELLPGAKDDNYFVPSPTEPMDVGFEPPASRKVIPPEAEIPGEAIKACY